MYNISILAQAETEEQSQGVGSEALTEGVETETSTKVPSDPNAGRTTTPHRRGFGSQELILFGLMFVVMYFFLFRGPRRKQQQQRKMVDSLEKNDRVRTIGGILGTVVDIKGDEITLKVDESNNTKIKVASSAVGRNLSKDKS